MQTISKRRKNDMKRIICILTLLCLCVTAVFAFAGCSQVDMQDLGSLIDKACSEEVTANTDYTLKAYGASVTNNDKISYELNYKTGAHGNAKFTVIDETDFKYTKYTSSYYGASVPSNKYTDYWASFPNSLFKLEKATEEDYQDWYFYDTTLYYDASASTKTYYTSKQNDNQSSSTFTVKRQLEDGWEEFFAMEQYAKCDIAYLAKAVSGIKDFVDYENDSNTVKTKGRVTTFTVKIKDECTVEYQGEKLGGKFLTIAFTNEKISNFKLEGKFDVFVAYGGAKIMMPNYDNTAYIDFANQVAA